MGEDLDPLSLRELQNLEQQLDTGLKRIRTKKVNVVLLCILIAPFEDTHSRVNADLISIYTHRNHFGYAEPTYA